MIDSTKAVKEKKVEVPTWIDPELKNYIVPSEIRENSIYENGQIFTPGSRIKIPNDAKYIRLFTAWGSRNGDSSFDIDLSGGFVGEDSDNNLYMSDISFYNQSENFATHSGDFTACKEFNPGDKRITAEYIDVDIERSSKKFKYVISSSFIYSSSNLEKDFSTDVHTYSGVSLLQNRGSEDKEINIDDSLFKMKLQSNGASHCALAIDLINKEIVVIDQYAQSRSGATLQSMRNRMNDMKLQYFNALDYKENMYNFIQRYCRVNDIPVVPEKEQANRIVSYKDYPEDKNQENFNIGVNLEKIISLLS